MSKLKKCPECKQYTLKTEHCTKKTQEAGYKFIKIKIQKYTSDNNK